MQLKTHRGGSSEITTAPPVYRLITMMTSLMTIFIIRRVLQGRLFLWVVSHDLPGFVPGFFYSDFFSFKELFLFLSRPTQ
ncbi:MAG: hypothetical protein IKX53_04450 [Bacteroidales bacterium]|nr:hypothetical protein [Bacteroidales bacterium]